MAPEGEAPAACNIGVDIGGTFTDVALEVGGRRFTAKTLTTHDAPERGVLAAIRDVLADATRRPADIDLITGDLKLL